MKTIQKMMTAMTLIVIITFTTQAAESAAVKKAKEAVAEAAPYDWKILAESADICFSKGENIDEAMKWIDKSIEINKDPLNLEVKADYLVAQGKNKQAMKYYVEAIKAGKEQNFWFDSSGLQAKIWKLR